MSRQSILLLIAVHILNCLSYHHSTSVQISTSLFAFDTDVLNNVATDKKTEVENEDISAVFVNALIKSPLYTPIVTMAKNTMIKSAASAGLDWKRTAQSIRDATPNWEILIEEIKKQRDSSFTPPSYFIQPFHGYKEGNLCLDAAFEQEIAG